MTLDQKALVAPVKVHPVTVSVFSNLHMLLVVVVVVVYATKSVFGRFLNPAP